MDSAEVKAIKWAIYALMGEVSIDEIMTNSRLVDAFVRLERVLLAL